MNILTSAPRAINRSVPRNADQVTLSASTPSWGKSAVDAVSAHPYRSISDVVSLSTAIGSLAASDNSPTGQFFKLASGLLAAGHVLSAICHGSEGKKAGVTAVGELVSAAGHGAMLAGVGPVGMGMVAFGNMITTISDFNR